MSPGTGASMQALVASGGEASVTEVPLPPADGSEVVVRPTTALLTPLERAVAAGGLSSDGTDAPRILGTAVVGIVEMAPAGGALRPGTRVAVQPVLSCGRCERCRSGLAIHCADRRLVGIDAPGGAAERIVLPPAACLPVPDALDDERAVFAVPLARAIEAVRRGGVARRSFASVVGDDLLAVLATLVAVEENPLARLVSRSEATLRIAEQLGVRHRADADTGRRGDQELVIDTVGSATSIEAAVRMARPRGHVVVAGLGARSAVAVDLSRVALEEIEVLGSGFGPVSGALGLLAQGVVDPGLLVSRRAKLGDAAAALALVGGEGVLSVLLQVSR